jgi:hypothetical protein
MSYVLAFLAHPDQMHILAAHEFDLMRLIYVVCILLSLMASACGQQTADDWNKKAMSSLTKKSTMKLFKRLIAQSK